MNTVINKMLGVIKKKDPSLHPSIAMNAIHYNLGSLASINRTRLVLPDGTKIFTNYFGITFAPSGVGKDRADAITKEMTEKVLDEYLSILLQEYTKFNAKNDGEKVSLPTFEFERATPEGFLQARVDIQAVGYGITNLKIPELQDALSSKEGMDFLSDIVKTWETGESGAKTNRGRSIPATKGIPTNILIYGSPVEIHDTSKKGQELKARLTSGLARRTFIAYPSEEEVKNMMLDYIDGKVEPKNTSEEIGEIADYLFQTVARNQNEITLSDEAYQIYLDYDRRCKRLSLDESNDTLSAEIRSRAWKTLRLAGLYAWVCQNEAVTAKDMNDAIEYSEHQSKEAVEFLREKSKQEQIVKYILANGRVSREELMRVILKTTRTSEFNDVIYLANEFASSMNYIIEKEGDKAPFYKVKKLNQIDENNITVSISKDKDFSEGWVPVTGAWKDLPLILKSDEYYSAGTFKNNKRLNENYEESQDLIILDIDSGMSLDSAKAFFSNFKAFIATTRNHLKEKHPGKGDVEERFRVVLLPSAKINLPADKYSDFMLNLIDILGVPADKKVLDPARFYFGYPNAEVWESPGTNRFDISLAMPETTHSEETFSKLEHYDDVEGIERYFIAATNVGERNDSMYRYACVLVDEGYTKEEIEQKTLELNRRITDSLPEREIYRTVLKSIERHKLK